MCIRQAAWSQLWWWPIYFSPSSPTFSIEAPALSCVLILPPYLKPRTCRLSSTPLTCQHYFSKDVSYSWFHVDDIQTKSTYRLSEVDTSLAGTPCMSTPLSSDCSRIQQLPLGSVEPIGLGLISHFCSPQPYTSLRCGFPGPGLVDKGNMSVVAAAQSCSSFLPTRREMARLSWPTASVSKFPAQRNSTVVQTKTNKRNTTNCHQS